MVILCAYCFFCCCFSEWNSHAGLNCVQAKLEYKQTHLDFRTKTLMLIPEKKPINISEKKEKRRRETIKPRKRKFILLFFNGFSQYRLRIRLWRCLDLFGRASHVTFECLHFAEYWREVNVVEEKVVKMIFFDEEVDNRGWFNTWILLWGRMWML